MTANPLALTESQRTVLRTARLLFVAIANEIIGVLLLVALVALSRPTTQAEANVLAQQIGTWEGPLSGFVLTLFGARFIARRTPHPLRDGITLGVVAAVLDGALLAMSGVAFAWLYVASNAGRVLAGGLGGWWATRRTP